jgi:hypothetical protein
MLSTDLEQHIGFITEHISYNFQIALFFTFHEVVISQSHGSLQILLEG